jgi:hypothetical protein
MNRVSHTLMTRIARCRCRTTAADASGRCRLQPGRESAPCAGGRADGRHQQGGRLRAHLHRRVRAAGRWERKGRQTCFLFVMIRMSVMSTK